MPALLEGMRKETMRFFYLRLGEFKVFIIANVGEGVDKALS